MRPPQYASVAAAAFLFLLMPAWPAAAYLDPGTGSLILQSIIGALAGAMVAVHVYWRRIKSFLTRKGDVDKDTKEGKTDQL
jgi:hypothetical protein